METLTNSRRTVVLLFMIFFLATGCATHISKPSREPQPATVRFSNFSKVEMKEAKLSPNFAGAAANQRALDKINEKLVNDMKMLFPGIAVLPAEGDFSAVSRDTLQITPTVKEIKFIGGGARFMVGAMAGSSAVLMQAVFRDGNNDRIIADPEFYRSANAHAGGWSIGVTDNLMLDEIAKDVVNYCSYNK